MELPFFLYDVFTDKAFGGGQLAVVDCRGLREEPTDELMQSTAKEFGFPETTFVFESEMSEHTAKVRIFTPGEELPMAGHPTIGTSIHLFDNSNLDNNFVLELGVGPTPIEIVQDEKSKAFMLQQSAQSKKAAASKEAIAAALGTNLEALHKQLPYEFFSAGLMFLIVPFNSVSELYDATPTKLSIQNILEGERCVYAFAIDDDLNEIHCRMFIKDLIDALEDPATGSAAGSLAHYLDFYLPEVLEDEKQVELTQGVALDRPSKIYISIVEHNGHKIPRVGGSAIRIGSGQLSF